MQRSTHPLPDDRVAREASHCMTSKTIPAVPEERQQKAARSRQRMLGKALAELYASVATEPAPDEFMRLLAETDSKTAASPKR